MSPKNRTRLQGDLLETIKQTAWRQIAQLGAPALSLRAIARELHITAPAIYNYYPRRDYLVTALIIDAFTSFGDSQLAARDAVSPSDLLGRLMAIGVAYRQWALAYPQRYQLIFGAPIPGYQPPVEKIMPAGARSLVALVGTVAALRSAGRLRVEQFPKLTPGHKTEFDLWRQHTGDTDLLSLSISMLIWSRVHGLVSLEIAGSLPPFGSGGDALYRYELESIRQQFFKEASQ
jgi:AcrR family transcriptional regulator